MVLILWCLWKTSLLFTLNEVLLFGHLLYWKHRKACGTAGQYYNMCADPSNLGGITPCLIKTSLLQLSPIIYKAPIFCQTCFQHLWAGLSYSRVGLGLQIPQISIQLDLRLQLQPLQPLCNQHDSKDPLKILKFWTPQAHSSKVSVCEEVGLSHDRAPFGSFSSSLVVGIVNQIWFWGILRSFQYFKFFVTFLRLLQSRFLCCCSTNSTALDNVCNVSWGWIKGPPQICKGIWVGQLVWSLSRVYQLNIDWDDQYYPLQLSVVRMLWLISEYHLYSEKT